MESRLSENREMFENYYIPRLKWQTDAPVAFMLRRIDKDPNSRSVEIIKYWSSLHYEALIPELILRITYTEIVGLKDYRNWPKTAFARRATFVGAHWQTGNASA